jgi:hypothetical protein
MHALRIALSFVLVPRLFVSLILFPLLLSIVFVIGQMFVTRLFLKSIEQSESAAATPATQVRRESLIRLILFGSADLMTRNLDYRVEVTTPVYNNSLKAEIKEWLHIQLSDTTKARSLHSGEINNYICPLDSKLLKDSQVEWKEYLESKSAKV